MNTMMVGVLGLVAVVVPFGLSPLAAQDMETQQDQITADSPELAVLVAEREESILQQDLEDAQLMVDSAEAAIRELERLRELVRGRIEVRKREKETFEARIDLADKENRDTERARLERQRETIEQHIELLERLRDTYDAERRYEQSRRDYGRSSVEFFEREQELSAMRMTDSTTGHVLLTGDFMDVQGETLDAQKDRADRQKNMAERHKDLLDRRSDLLEAQIEWLSRQAQS